MSKKFKYNVEYLYTAYKKNYNKGNMEKATLYNTMATQLHGISLDVIYHQKLNKREDRLGTFGIGKSKKIKYG